MCSVIGEGPIRQSNSPVGGQFERDAASQCLELQRLILSAEEDGEDDAPTDWIGSEPTLSPNDSEKDGAPTDGRVDGSPGDDEEDAA